MLSNLQLNHRQHVQFPETRTIMSSIDDPGSGKAEEQAPGKTSGSPRDTSSASSYRSAKEEHQAHERLEYLKQDIVKFQSLHLTNPRVALTALHRKPSKTAYSRGRSR